MSKVAPLARAYEILLARGRLQPSSAQAALVERLSDLQQALLINSTSTGKRRTVSNNHGVYIFGGVGTGKSRIADLFASTLPQAISSRRIHFHQFMVDVHMRLHRARSAATYSGDPLIQIGREICSESPVLCFDEFQVSDIADAMILKRLFGSFWQSGGVMISTSNRHPTELYMNGLNRPLFIPFIRELQERCLVWKMEGEHDYRMNDTSRDRVQVYFTDLDGFNAALKTATGHGSLRDVEIKVVMNRSITVRASYDASHSAPKNSNRPRAVVQGTFTELCEASRGTSDYHALCNFARTIYISGIYQFAADQLDFVRRFITLIDIAYESRTRVVCLSDTPLIELFKHVGVSSQSIRSEMRANGNQGVLVDGGGRLDKNLNVKKGGGSSSSMMSTFIDDVEWSATGLRKASLATGGAGETDVRFAIGRAISRLSEMGSMRYGVADDND